jgi:hypothetical protein
MNIAGYAACPFHIALPPQKAGRNARLPAAAIALARHAVGEQVVDAATAVYFGTAYGDATETEAFVENMIVNHEEFPKPRAFAASVHNAMASRLAMALGLHGPNRTYVHGEMSFLLALRAARHHPTALVGALDESTPLIRAGHETCGHPLAGEGGGVLYCRNDEEGALARVVFDRDADIWIRAAGHPAMPAALAAMATAVLAGQADPTTLELSQRPRRIGIRVASRFGERGRFVLEAVR